MEAPSTLENISVGWKLNPLFWLLNSGILEFWIPSCDGTKSSSRVGHRPYHCWYAPSSPLFFIPPILPFSLIFLCFCFVPCNFELLGSLKLLTYCFNCDIYSIVIQLWYTDACAWKSWATYKNFISICMKFSAFCIYWWDFSTLIN